MRICENMKAARQKCGISQEALAKKSGISNSVLSFWENGKRYPSIELAKCAADALGISTQEYLFGNPVSSADYAELEKKFKACVNELCYRCGQYTSEHLGACNGCRWRH